MSNICNLTPKTIQIISRIQKAADGPFDKKEWTSIKKSISANRRTLDIKDLIKNIIITKNRILDQSHVNEMNSILDKLNNGNTLLIQKP